VNSERVFGAIDRERVPIPRLLYAALEYVWFENRDWALGIGDWELGMGLGRRLFMQPLCASSEWSLA